MGQLRRTQLAAQLHEASALITAGAPDRWWLAHDEAGLPDMVSLLTRADELTSATESWALRPLRLSTPHSAPAFTDAEALASDGTHTFIVGSGFTGPKGRIDRRRSFIARFTNDAALGDDRSAVGSANPDSTETIELTATADVLDLGTALLTHLNETIARSEVVALRTERKAQRRFSRSLDDSGDAPDDLEPINIEGAAIVSGDLVLGLRWPVSQGGDPMLVTLLGAADVLAAPAWSVEALMACPGVVGPLQAGGSPKRPVGVRGLSVGADGSLHAIVGSTERDLVAGKAKAAEFRHVAVDRATGSTTDVESFSGYRKVEALAPLADRWMYALDDEDAIVILSTT